MRRGGSAGWAPSDGSEATSMSSPVTEPRQEPGRVNVVGADPWSCRLVEHCLQFAAVNRELRIVMASVAPTRLAPDLPAESVGVDQFMGTNRDAIEYVEQTKFCKFLDCVWERIDADAEFTNLERLLEHHAL